MNKSKDIRSLSGRRPANQPATPSKAHDKNKSTAAKKVVSQRQGVKEAHRKKKDATAEAPNVTTRRASTYVKTGQLTPETEAFAETPYTPRKGQIPSKRLAVSPEYSEARKNTRKRVVVIAEERQLATPADLDRSKRTPAEKRTRDQSESSDQGSSVEAARPSKRARLFSSSSSVEPMDLDSQNISANFDINEIETQIDNTQEKLQDAERHIKHLEKELEKVKRSADEKLQDADAVIERHKRLVDQKFDELTAITKDKHELISQLKAAEERLRKAEKGGKQDNEKTRELKDKLLRMQNKIDFLTEKETADREGYENALKKQDERMADLRKEFEAREQRNLQDHERATREAYEAGEKKGKDTGKNGGEEIALRKEKQHIQNIERNLETEKKKTVQLNKDLENLNLKLQHAKTRERENSQKIQEQDRTIGSLNKQLTDEKKAVKDTKAEIINLNNQKSQLEKKQASLEKELEQITEELKNSDETNREALEDQKATTLRMLKDSHIRRNDIQTALKGAKRRNNLHIKVIRKLNDKIIELERKLNEKNKTRSTAIATASGAVTYAGMYAYSPLIHDGIQIATNVVARSFPFLGPVAETIGGYALLHPRTLLAAGTVIAAGTAYYASNRLSNRSVTNLTTS